LTHEKLCFVISSATLGGAERQIYYLIDASKKNYKVKLICYSANGPAIQLYKNLQIEFEHINLSNRLLKPFGPILLFISLAKINAKNVQTFLYKADVLVTLFSYILPIKSVYWTAGNIDIPGFSRTKKLAIRVFSKSKKVKKIVANSKTAADWHVKIGYPSNKLRVIPNFLPNARNNHESRSVLLQDSIVDKPIRIGMACRPVEGKGIDILLRASEILTNMEVSHTVNLVGDGMEKSDYVEGLINKLNSKSNVVLHAGQSDIWSFLENIDVYVMASTSWESFPNSLTEAILIGCPVVVSDVGEIAFEIFGIKDTYTANSEDQLAASILMLLKKSSQKRRADAENLCTSTLKKFDNSQTYAKWLETWNTPNAHQKQANS
jgi:glycosyltransferase involved in cell wall biosynthesis